MNSKIIKLAASNVKRLKAIEITPDGNVVVVGGRNAQGKTSVLDAIMFALGGTKTLPKSPVRKGEDKGSIVVELEDLIVKRTFTAEGGTSLTVTNKENAKYPSPQAILDALIGRMTFDPLEFARSKPEVQAVTLRQLVGLDFNEINQRREKLYNERTMVNREAKSLENRLAACPPPVAGLPDEPLSAVDILAEQREAMEHNRKVDEANSAIVKVDSEIIGAESALNKIGKEMLRITAEIARLNDELKTLAAEAETYNANWQDAHSRKDALVKAANLLQKKDISAITAKLETIEGKNRQINNNKARQTIADSLKAKVVEAENLTKAIDGVDAEKAKLIRESKFPIDGLSVDESGDVVFNGIPFSQASGAEQLRVSVAIGLALNPKLRVLLIRDGSLLDDTNMALLFEMAAAADAQIWIERVGEAGDVSVIIEDGMVKASETPKKEGQLL